ncbi:hypothetical protein [Ewingella americana]|uniref:hypothetical protein n=1 Tax=Ewingella americana TaxID=41202 RepID=UPI003B96782C
MKTGEGWLYLAAVMDLCSWRIVCCHVDSRMRSSLVYHKLMKAYNLLNPPHALVCTRTEGHNTPATASSRC